MILWSVAKQLQSHCPHLRTWDSPPISAHGWDAPSLSRERPEYRDGLWLLLLRSFQWCANLICRSWAPKAMRRPTYATVQKPCTKTPPLVARTAQVFGFSVSGFTGLHFRSSYLRLCGVPYRPCKKTCLGFQTLRRFALREGLSGCKLGRASGRNVLRRMGPPAFAILAKREVFPFGCRV